MITCDQHDYVEIICMYKFRVKIVTLTRTVHQGTAIDTLLNKHRQECVLIETTKGHLEIPLDGIRYIDVYIKHEPVKTIHFR
ncbi:Rho-binding antiterminator [Psychrobium sp. 1_MG-2023]|uniref:Rho-binding antiterminator n=1 Tax=Psychrobium sp. 1_MG-2023 TaxID=3062624 RepID=UPI0026853ED3|nr:Rho-binding antiterminator [Psychrobium sp. 1_MG-2023]MDP2561763.1 Rho-binding antiterminator [Psychrobium sp. 1_MG-2023]